MSYLNFNGKILPATTPIIGADNRGLRYGDGLFETFIARNGQLILFDEHLARLWTGLTLLKFNPPKFFSPDKLQQETDALLQKNKFETARIRLSVFRGDGGLYDHNNSLQYLIQCWPLPASTGSFNENGLELGIYRDAKKIVDAFSNCKHSNFLPYVMAAMYAKERKLNDAVLLNQYGRICDTTIANIFIIKNDQVFTPPLSEGCIAGIMRKSITQTLSENGRKVNEEIITEEFLLDADEVFTTNSVANMRWVKALGSKLYTAQKTQEIHQLLRQTLPILFC